MEDALLEHILKRILERLDTLERRTRHLETPEPTDNPKREIL